MDTLWSPPSPDTAGGKFWEPELASRLPPLGSVLSCLMAAERRELERAILQSRHTGRKGSTAQAVEFLLQHVNRALKMGASIEHICMPLLEHVVKSKQQSNRKKALAIMHWLFATEGAGFTLAKSLADIIGSSQCDHSIKLGVCVVIRDLLQNSSTAVAELTLSMSQTIPVFSKCLPQLVELVRNASVKEGNKKSPTRLTIAAADCALVITRMLAVGDPAGKEDTSNELNQSKQLLDYDRRDSDAYDKWDMILWHQLDNLNGLVSELYEWNHWTRVLHARGLMQVSKHLQDLTTVRESAQGEKDIWLGISVLKSCWQEYARLIVSEDQEWFSNPEVLVQQLLSAFQPSDVGETSSEKMRCYILACLALLLGRLDSELLSLVMTKFEGQFLELLFNQLTRNEEDTVDIAVFILKFLLFRQSASEASSAFLSNMDTFAPFLMDLLDKRDITSRAVVHLVAEYLSLHPSPDLQKVFSMLDSKEAVQRRNAIDVISELLQIVCDSKGAIVSSLSHNIAKHLLTRLGDEELVNRTAAATLFAKLDATFVLPRLIQLVYDSDGRIRSAASTALVSVLKGHSDQQQVVCVLLDCVRNTAVLAQPPKNPGEIGKRFPSHQADLDRIMRLIPSWACTVEDWNLLVPFLLNKMFADPSNPVIPRFLSEISNKLADMYHAVFPRILQAMQENIKSMVSMEHDDPKHLFCKLSPLLVLRVLPLRAYDHMDCKELYGTPAAPEQSDIACQEASSITYLLIKWMCDPSEFDDVRKLSAELAGRLLPQVMLPVVIDQFKAATESLDVIKVKSCIYAICNSLMVRGSRTLCNPLMRETRTLLTRILLWPSFINEVQKAQHGCIDCFAIMIRAELDRDRTTIQECNESHQLIKEQSGGGTQQEGQHGSVLHGVICCLKNQAHSLLDLSGMSALEFSESRASLVAMEGSSADGDVKDPLVPISFRLCMANALISCSSKIPSSSHELFSRKMLPAIMGLLQVEKQSIVKAACIQVLFNAVYNLKAALLVTYANNLLAISLAALKGPGSSEERIAGAKLLASLLANEPILNEIGSSLMDVQRALSSISQIDSSPELRKLCDQLLSCISS